MLIIHSYYTLKVNHKNLNDYFKQVHCVLDRYMDTRLKIIYIHQFLLDATVINFL